MLGQHVIDHRTIFVALGFAIGLDHLIDCIHQRRAVGQPQFLDEKIRLDRLKLCRLAARNRRGIGIVNRRTAANRHLGQQIHIRFHPAFIPQIIRVFRDQVVTLSHHFSPIFRQKAGPSFYQAPQMTLRAR